MRRAARTDANQKQIVQALRNAGAFVWVIGRPVDLLVGYKTKTLLMEVKTTRKSKLTALQEDFFANWPAPSLVRVNSPEDALKAIHED